MTTKESQKAVSEDTNPTTIALKNIKYSTTRKEEDAYHLRNKNKNKYNTHINQEQ